MAGFDIENLLEFHPARKWCLRCLALWENFYWENLTKEESINWLFDDPLEGKRDYNAFLINERNNFLQCKVCGVKYIGTNDCSVFSTSKFIDNIIGSPLKNIDNIVEHGRRLASISHKIRTQKEKYLSLRALLMVLVEARSFVHFISWGITQLIIGALKMVAQFVPVRGIVSGNVGEQIICEVTDFKHEAPNLEIVFCESNSFRTSDIPQQKLIVIDGLLAFKGSANLTQMAWRSAAKGTEIIEVVSNTDEIINLHNQFFSPIWGKMNNHDDEITLYPGV